MAEWNEGTGNGLDLLRGNARQLANPANPVRTNLDVRNLNSDVAGALTTAVMLSTAIDLRAGDVVTDIGVQFGATAAVVPTHWWFALYSTATTPAKLAQTADQTTGAIAANAYKELALSAAQLITETGVYYVGICVVADTVPSLVCNVAPTAACNGAIVSGFKVRAQTSGSALTGTAPSTIATTTTVVNTPLVVCR